MCWRLAPESLQDCSLNREGYLVQTPLAIRAQLEFNEQKAIGFLRRMMLTLLGI